MQKSSTFTSFLLQLKTMEANVVFYDLQNPRSVVQCFMTLWWLVENGLGLLSSGCSAYKADSWLHILLFYKKKKKKCHKTGPEGQPWQTYLTLRCVIILIMTWRQFTTSLLSREGSFWLLFGLWDVWYDFVAHIFLLSISWENFLCTVGVPQGTGMGYTGVWNNEAFKV